MRVPLVSLSSPVQSQNLSLLALVILQTEGHPALGSDPLMEDTSVSVYAEGRNIAPITIPGLQMTGTREETYSLNYSILQVKSPLL